MALIGAIPSILQLAGVYFIPESPRWLAKIGKEKDYETALHRLRGDNADISEEAVDIKDYMETARISENNFLQLFRRKYAHPLTISNLVKLGRNWTDGATTVWRDHCNHILCKFYI